MLGERVQGSKAENDSSVRPPKKINLKSPQKGLDRAAKFDDSDLSGKNNKIATVETLSYFTLL